MGEPEVKRTEWNMAMAYYMRVSELLDRCTEYALDENGREWYKALLRVLTEARPKLTDKEKDEVRKLLPELADAFKKLPRGRSMNPDLYSMLSDFEDRLRELMEKHDMLIPNKEEVTRF
ncbi:MAG TPA: hypothetical protein VMV86_02115 [Methanosarcinales archaeon]|nr:hypothetical protein [Methanosarcinales archaeon]